MACRHWVMPFDEALAGRVRRLLKRRRGVTERRMFGGLCFLLNGNMCCGVERGRLVVRTGPTQYERALKRPYARPMDFTGRPLKGFVYVDARGCRSAAALKAWITLGADFAASLPKKPKAHAA